jgi:hypothetical protein
LYRATFLVVVLPLVVLAFSVVRLAPLAAPVLPPNFDGDATRALATELSDHFPDRSPGGSGSLRADEWFRDQMRQYGLRVHRDRWTAHVPGIGSARLENLWAVAAGQSRDAIVVMAHRDDTGAGPGANDNASGTAALVELARGYALSAAPSAGVRTAHTIVFLSTDGGAFGGLGALRFAEHPPFRIAATVNLDAIAGSGEPRVEIAGDSPRSPAAALVETAARRVQEQGQPAVRPSVLGQLIDLGFPFTLYEQGPFVGRGIPAITLTTAGARPPDAFTDRSSALSTPRLTAIGRATQQLIGSLDQGAELAQGTTTYVWFDDRIVRGWAIELTLFALLLPFVVAVVDLFAHLRRRRIPLLPAVRSLRSRVLLWLFAGLAFYTFRAFGAWPSGEARPPSPATRSRRSSRETPPHYSASRSSRCSFWQQTRMLSSSSSRRSMRGCGCRRCGGVHRRLASSSSCSGSRGPRCSSSRSPSASASASTRRGTSPSSQRWATCASRRWRSRSPQPAARRSSRR